MKDGLYRVDHGAICAHFVIENGRVTHCAPVLKRNLERWMKQAEIVPDQGPPTYLFTGSRLWKDNYIVDLILSGLKMWSRRDHEHVVICEGDAPGLDKMAGEKAKMLGMEVREYPADWKGEGKRAGPVRNQAMLDGEYVKTAFAFPLMDDSRSSKIIPIPCGPGTYDMIKRCKREGIPVYVIAKL